MKRSHITAIAVVSLSSLWLLSGLLNSKTPEAGQLQLEEEPVTAVRARLVEGHPHEKVITIRGRTEAMRKVELRSELDGSVAELPVEKGEAVSAGDVICRLSIDDRQAKLDEAQAVMRQRELEANAAIKLAAKGHRSDTQVAAAKAQLDAAKAQVSRIEVELENTAIRAPFDGIVNTRPVEIGAYLKAGEVCAQIVEVDPFLVVGNVSEQNVGEMHVGDTGTVTLSDGRQAEGTVRYVSSVAEETTRTFRVEMVINNSGLALRDGMTAMVRIPVGMTQAHLISPAFLVLNDAGEVGVRTVDADDRVRFKQVNIVDDGENGVWITGLSPTETVITVGHEFVRNGQKVRAEIETRDPAA